MSNASQSPTPSSNSAPKPPTETLPPNLVLRTPISFHFLAGLSTGVISAFLLQPADLLKTRVQQSPSTTLFSTLRSITTSPNAVRSLWRGTLPSIIRTGFGSALYFTGLNALREGVAKGATPSSALLPATLAGAAAGMQGEGGETQAIGTPATSSSSLPKLSNSANLFTGAVARASAGFVLMPLTVIKVRYESSLYSYRSLWGATGDILRKEGVRGLFSGFGATAVRDAPYAGLYVVGYEKLKPTLGAFLYGRTKEEEGKERGNGVMTTSQSATTNFLSGVLAAGVATALTNPFDAVKTRLQLMPGRYGNLVRAARMMVREEGVRSLFDGLALRIGRKAMSSALAWTLYEEMVRKAERKWVIGGGERKMQRL